MKPRKVRKSFCLVSWVLTLALTLSPLLGQNPPAPGLTPVEVSDDSVTEPVRESADATLGTPVPVESPVSYRGALFPIVAKRSTLTMPAFPPPRTAYQEPKSPGSSRWVILAVIGGAAAVVAAILLWPHSGDKPEPVGTVLAPGTPAVAAPGGR